MKKKQLTLVGFFLISILWIFQSCCFLPFVSCYEKKEKLRFCKNNEREINNSTFKISAIAIKPKKYGYNIGGIILDLDYKNSPIQNLKDKITVEIKTKEGSQILQLLSNDLQAKKKVQRKEMYFEIQGGEASIRKLKTWNGFEIFVHIKGNPANSICFNNL